MILVRTQLKPSAIHGIGIFAKQFIPKGTKGWEFRDGFDSIFSKEEIDKLSEAAREQILNYAYANKTGRYVLCTDDSRFSNHAFEANTTCVIPINANSEDSLECFATRDIQPDEELTNNYEEFDADLSGLELK